MAKKELIFTHRSDAEQVIRLQEKVFMEKSAVCQDRENWVPVGYNCFTCLSYQIPNKE